MKTPNRLVLNICFCERNLGFLAFQIRFKRVCGGANEKVLVKRVVELSLHRLQTCHAAFSRGEGIHLHAQSLQH